MAEPQIVGFVPKWLRDLTREQREELDKLEENMWIGDSSPAEPFFDPTYGITDEKLLEMASEFALGPQLILNGRYQWWKKFPNEEANERYQIRVRTAGQNRWAICEGDSNFCLNKCGELEWQPRPSERDDKLFKRCRYETVYEAINYYYRWCTVVGAWAEGEIKKANGKFVSLEYMNCPNLPKFEDVS